MSNLIESNHTESNYIVSNLKNEVFWTIYKKIKKNLIKQGF